ncbi:hypothetical protein P170DRAFT_287233 [Aspergillus steynii IBT 23096]|uniref:Uncharacterized protein n=1 Tax=Aspergillus steynii IBT 23096 TaxID=1392250 RepID=A0A2I2FV08_9EURO|nr:uncharacterized protein P170DRAFT_287233 [Aspergillus steynii IBT 23096]PLB44479.1 hypothetical protein P170DRAFT_287233 [Aspergillus steynii IBT 23096]
MHRLFRSTDVFPSHPPSLDGMRCRRDIIGHANEWIGRRQQSTFLHCPAGWVRPSTPEPLRRIVVSHSNARGYWGWRHLSSTVSRNPPSSHDDTVRLVQLTNNVCDGQIITS